MRTKSPVCFLVRGSALLASSCEDKPPGDFAPCGRSPLLASSCEDKLFLDSVGIESFPVSSCEDQPCLLPRARTSPLATSLHADEVPRLFPRARISPVCFLGRGQAPCVPRWSPACPPFSCLPSSSVGGDASPPSHVLGILPLFCTALAACLLPRVRTSCIFAPFQTDSPNCPDDKHVSLVQSRFCASLD